MFFEHHNEIELNHIELTQLQMDRRINHLPMSLKVKLLKELKLNVARDELMARTRGSSSIVMSIDNLVAISISRKEDILVVGQFDRRFWNSFGGDRHETNFSCL